MKAPSSSLARSAVFLFLATAGLAQTAIWIAPGPSVLPPPLPTITTAAWNTAANWDTGVVPNSSHAVAIINQSIYGGAMTPIVGGASPIITGDITLGELRFDLPGTGTTHFTKLYIGSLDPSGPAGRLRLDGKGLTLMKAGSVGSGSGTYVDLLVQPGSFLDFGQQASITQSGFIYRRLVLTGTSGQTAYVRFFDDASPGPSFVWDGSFSKRSDCVGVSRPFHGGQQLPVSAQRFLGYFLRPDQCWIELHLLWILRIQQQRHGSLCRQLDSGEQLPGFR